MGAVQPIALIDCNNFYCSCERVFNPKLTGKPVIVLSNNDGMPISRSEEAKAVGIEMAKPFFELKDIIEKHKVHVFSSNYTLYGDFSRRVMQTIRQFSPMVEEYSIDEAFVGLQGFAHRDLTEYGREMKATIYQWTGIPVSVGIAQDQGLFYLDQKIGELYPDARKSAGWDPPKDAITIGMLLSMTSGLDCNDMGIGNQNCGAVMGQSSNWVSFALGLPMAHPPGTVWTYNGCCLTLLSHAIAEKTGMRFADYANQYLLQPLGIKNNTWVTGPNGDNRVDYGLYWTSRDMAKLGQLYLNQGLWEGKRVVSADWVKDATAVHAPRGQAFGHDYGYLWHIKTMLWKNRPIRVFFANGYMGQEIYVSPDADLVCVMTAASSSALIYSMEDHFLENVILDSIQ